MQTLASFVGIDVAKATFDIAAPLMPGRYRTRAKVPNTPAGFLQLADWLDRHVVPGAWVVMEATGIYHEALAGFVHERGYAVCVANPAQIAAYARSELSRTKTDRTDAKCIARFAQGHVERLRRWQPEPPGQRTLRALVRRVEDLAAMRQMEANRLEGAQDAVHDSIAAVMALLDEQIQAARKAVEQHIDDDPDLRRRRDLLVSIPAIGEVTAAVLLAELGDTGRFNDVRAVVAFAGLNPALRQSGAFQGRAHISKIGSSRLRKGLYMPAVVALRHHPAVRALAERMRSRGKCNLVIVVAAMRKLLHIAYGVLKSGVPFNPNHGLRAAR